MNTLNGYYIQLSHANFATGAVGSYYKAEGLGTTKDFKEAHVFTKADAERLFDGDKHSWFAGVVDNTVTKVEENPCGVIIKTKAANFAVGMIGEYFKKPGTGTTKDSTKAHVFKTIDDLDGIYDEDKHTLIISF